MPKLDRFIVLPRFSITPTQVTSFNEIVPRHKCHETYEAALAASKSQAIKKPKKAAKQSVKRSHHNFKISQNAYRNLKLKINWLYHLSKARHVKTSNGRDIYNFKMGFLTLTLPSKQKHPTSFITKEILNQFLTEIRGETQMRNYIWRLEFQKNGNVHYHLVTDTYLNYFHARRVWNRCLSKYGYIEPYRAKHSAMSLSEYVAEYADEKHNDFNTLAKRYAKGKKAGWSQPPSIDMRSVASQKAIAHYISKYFSKDNEKGPKKNEFDTDENSASMRLWFCSRSLSKLKTITGYCEASLFDIFTIVKSCAKLVVKHYKYATCFYYEMRKFPKGARIFIEKLLKDYSVKQGYIPAGINTT